MGKNNKGLYTNSFTIEGKRYWVYGKTKEELYQKTVAKRTEIESGINKRVNPTLSEYFESWIDRRTDSISEATYRIQNIQFNAAAKVFITDRGMTFGEVKIKSIMINDLVDVQRALAEKRVSRGVNDVMATIKQLMTSAYYERLIDYNPCVLLKPLKRSEPKARDTYHRALTLEEQKTFFESEITRNSFYNNIFRLAILTGMRIGEIGALKYSDIKGGFIHVERTVTRTKSGGYKVGDSTKTKAGCRKIPINDDIRTVLDDQMELNKVLDGDNIRSVDDLLFRSVRREILKPYPVDRELKRICDALKIEKFTVHGFRDTFATRCVESGMQPKTLMEIMGHSNISMTMNIYTHVMDNTKVEAMNNVKILAM